ncbi:MAG: 1-acylglycerol-3-phosphate O-acyltransferase [Psychromonas sp.]|nr:1-acylglycerol-3-phosphate O-acyltransferase [Psychromonas sp.]
MLAIIRIILITICIILMSVYSFFYCLMSPRNPKNTYHFAMLFAKMSKIVGLNVIYRVPKVARNYGSVIYLANHQNNVDMLTTTGAVQPGSVTMGKKSLVLIPFFGIIYYLTGNILIDRGNKHKSRSTMDAVVDQIKKKKLGVWIFPEGTRSNGRGLLPFKMGAFHMALKAKVNIVPTVISNTHNQIQLNRWTNGDVIVEMMPPIDVSKYNKNDIRKLMEDCHEIMINKFDQLNKEVRRPIENNNNPD